ncbi:MAG: hypothetical protein U0939_22065 [Pirellulales bacterium]
MSAVGAEDEPDRRFFSFLRFVLSQLAQMELRLTFVGGPELPELQVDRDQTPPSMVIEQQVKVIVFSRDREAFRPSEGSKVAA